ncbi:YaeQ family protein [Vibrio sp. TRT 17S01]|uniref:YaeQ family protein n=1 Tax=Vibrio sp. TRT 17S01 TaxID=3418505 RepID=UPI003CF8A162
MALKPTIFKFRIALSDTNRDYYDTVNLTIAQHPSENLPRMIARVLAFCLNAQEGLTFTKGLSNIDEPDIWLQSLDGQTELWIEVGEPAVDRIKKACRQAKSVKVYSFNSKSNVWWEQTKNKVTQYPVEIVRFPWEPIEELANNLVRTMELSIMLTGTSLFIDSDSGSTEVCWETLQSNE